MYDDALKELEYISKAVGVPVDYTQGGGGNTSVKLDENLMAVKASGYQLKQITPKEGYVIVNYRDIRRFYQGVDLSQDRDYEKESAESVKNSVVETEGLKTLRPSVEAGFHSILKKYVIHTHSVYANMICCTKNGRQTVEKIFKNREYAVGWIPYINPGFCLTLKIREEINRCMEDSGRFPEVIFMENHGLVVNSDDSRKCVDLHREVNDAIKEYLGIRNAFPDIELVKVDDSTFISKTGYLSDYFQSHKVSAEFFDKTVLYPDQLVYLNGNVSVNAMDKKLNINTETGQITYKAGFSKARTIEETLLAYIYVIRNINRCGLPLKTMSEKEIDFIRNWESEAYRKSLVKELGK